MKNLKLESYVLNKVATSVLNKAEKKELINAIREVIALSIVENWNNTRGLAREIHNYIDMAISIKCQKLGI